MGQKFLIKPIANKQELEDLRSAFLTHPEICVPHKENGTWYGSVIDGNDQLECMLCISSEAEQYCSQAQLDALVTEIPANFIDDPLL